MKYSIVFVSIFDLTRVFYEISKNLAARGHSIYWITTNELWTNWLLSQGVKESDLLQLVYGESDFLSETEKAELQGQIVACEANADLSINQCLLMDQFVRYKNKPTINDYMYLYYRDIKNFLVNKKVTHVFAEPTNVNELITYMICRELGLRFLSPRDMRYPHRRLVFNDGYLQSQVLAKETVQSRNGDRGRELLEQFAERQSVPLYFDKLNKERVITVKKAVTSTMNRIKSARVSSRKHLTHPDLPERLQRMATRVVNGFYLRHLCSYTDLEDVSGRVAFYPLHVQPESSIDVLGSYFSDQLKLIKDIRRALPFDTTLVVKEHSNLLGLKSIGFFRQLRRIPNTKLVRHDVSTFDIYKRSSIVFTVSGTSGYEAAMLGIPVVTFARMYFDGLSAVHYCHDITELKPLVFKLLNGFERDYEADCHFMSDLISRSQGGYWTDPHFDPAVMEPANMEKLTEAFVRVLEGDSA